MWPEERMGNQSSDSNFCGAPSTCANPIWALPPPAGQPGGPGSGQSWPLRAAHPSATWELQGQACPSPGPHPDAALGDCLLTARMFSSRLGSPGRAPGAEGKGVHADPASVGTAQEGEPNHQRVGEADCGWKQGMFRCKWDRLEMFPLETVFT